MQAQTIKILTLQVNQKHNKQQKFIMTLILEY